MLFRYRLADLYISREDVRIIKKDGTEVVIIGGSLDILSDPITGKTAEGVDVSIYESEIQDAVRA